MGKLTLNIMSKKKPNVGIQSLSNSRAWCTKSSKEIPWEMNASQLKKFAAIQALDAAAKAAQKDNKPPSEPKHRLYKQSLPIRRKNEPLLNQTQVYLSQTAILGLRPVQTLLTSVRCKSAQRTERLLESQDLLWI